FRFSFGRPERLRDRLTFFLVHSKAYYNLIRPLKWLLLKTGTLGAALEFRPLQMLLLPLVARIKDRNLYPLRRSYLKPDYAPDDRAMRALVEQGYADLSDEVRISPAQAQAVVDYFYAARAYDSQVPLNSSFQTFPVRDILAAN